jgi:PEP-CTERM motif
VLCYEFFLDINENNGANAGTDADKYLSLDLLQIYTSTTPNQGTSDPSTLGDLVYTMGTDNHVGLDFNLGTGSGRADMSLWVPVSLFPSDGSLYVYLYSMFGSVGTIAGGSGLPAGNYGASDGFEEWALGKETLDCTQIDCEPGQQNFDAPEPASIALMGTGLSAIALRLRRRRATKPAEKI